MLIALIIYVVVVLLISAVLAFMQWPEIETAQEAFAIMGCILLWPLVQWVMVCIYVSAFFKPAKAQTNYEDTDPNGDRDPYYGAKFSSNLTQAEIDKIIEDRRRK